jgi:unsaturated rhamnogalacturonyl hydrolase
MTSHSLRTVCICILIASCSPRGIHRSNPGTWPAGASPEEVGRRVAARFIASPHHQPDKIAYPEVCTWYGALTFARVTGDSLLRAKLIARFDPLFAEESALVPISNHVDNTVFAAVPFELYIQTGDPKYLMMGKVLADRQWSAPFGPNASEESWEFYHRGLSWQTRMWIDDMFMITAAQAQAYRATRDETYINRAAAEMVVYLDSLQQPNGLFYHAPDVPFFWGRGDGWMAAGMSELLRSLPENSPYHARIMKGYRAMMATLLKYQGDDGMWRQLIDHPESWQETSSTGMFTFAFITGVRNGWLDEDVYGPAARKAWLALITYINDDGDVREVCQGTGKRNDYQYYMDRKRITGDMHGQAPVLWCATAFLR